MLYEEQIIPPGAFVKIDGQCEYPTHDSMSTKIVSSDAGRHGIVLACVKHGHKALPKTTVCLVLARDGNHWLLMDYDADVLLCNSREGVID